MDWGNYVTGISAFMAALAAAFGTIYVGRANAKKDISQALDVRFNALLDQYQEERKELNSIIKDRDATIETYRITIEKMFNESQTGSAERRTLIKKLEDLEDAIRIYEKHIDKLSKIIEGAGLTPPKNPKSAAA